MAKQAKATLEVEHLDAVADRGYFDSEEILACENAGVTVTLPKPMTSNSKAEGRFGKQDFRYVAKLRIVYKSGPLEKRLAYHFTNGGKRIGSTALLDQRLPAPARSSNSARPASSVASPAGSTSTCLRLCNAGSTNIRRRCASGMRTVEHPFGTIKAWMGATHFLMKTLPKVATEMALHVLAYNLTRVMNIIGVQPLLAAMRA